MIRKTTMTIAVLAGVIASAVLTLPRASHADPPCDHCKSVSASWDWKANGYAVAAAADAAHQHAFDSALSAACERSAGFLKGRKLGCKFGCVGGDITTSCAPSKKPGCTSGTFSDDPGMWRFVCRKTAKRRQRVDCSDERAAKEPGYGMCDVKVRMVKERSCHDPKCSPPDAPAAP